MSRTNLKTIYDTRKSFYDKAVVKQKDNKMKLYSYNTLVMTVKEVDKNEVDPFRRYEIEVVGTYSQTTTRHIREFLMQLGHEHMTRDEIESHFTKN